MKKVLFISLSSKSSSLGYFGPGVPPSSIYLYGNALSISFSLSCEESRSTKWPYEPNLILLKFMTSWTPFSCILFWYIGGSLITYPFHLIEYIKAALDEQTIPESTDYVARDIKRFVLLYDSELFLLKS